MLYHVTNVKWDATEEESEEMNLPTEMVVHLDDSVPANKVKEALSNAITSDSGFGCFGFDWEIEPEDQLSL